jgi:DUF1680 family protein
MTLPVSSQPQGSAERQPALNPVAHTSVRIEGGFWAPRLLAVREHTLPFIYEQLKKDEHFAAFHENWQQGTSPTPYVFWDSDISKWIEAASYSLASYPDSRLEAMVDEAVDFFVARQQPDGYLNLWFIKFGPEMRWSNLRDWHELYCAGHFIEAAVAHFQATGKRKMLDAACRYADYIDSVFGREEGKRRGYCGHEEIELALVKLYRATGEMRYLRLSQYFIDERGRQPHYFDSEARARGEDPASFWARTYEYNQSHLPVREQAEVVGHAVRAMYLYSAMTDLAKELHDPSLLQTCTRLWQHLTSKRLYITGGLGSSGDNEGMTVDYDLPNDTAYAETCASIGLILWNHRLLQIDTDHRYADLLERALYNGVLSGLALNGEAFFYENPLESHGTHHRQEWFKCACCPPNVARLLTSLGQYIYSTSNTDVMVHLYIQSTSTLSVAGQQVVLKQETSYPWDGTITLSLEMEQPAEFGLHLRIPGWCKQSRLTVNGEELPIEQHLHKGYVRIARSWQAADSVTLDLAMPVERVYAHPDVLEDVACVALQRGPLVYCLEQVDNNVPLHRLRLSPAAKLESHFEQGLLGGVTVVEADATALETEDWSGVLYRTTPPTQRSHKLVAIPYYAWDQRQSGEMRVWIHEE